ncbi:MAG: carbamoyl-phosphate synthase (glutamine-hydrolyzing) large subunit [Candidatus Levybacteria bacterium]|nr:carbamoyl-phosphate synthase (glutamine-hydrolyzing) large subunit [Candidatus Levybacteria bacterium]
MKIKKVLVLGSGALKIGEAGEFDYSGSQAIKALKEEGIKTVLVNPNIATIQTSENLADKIYFLPINSFFVEKVIKKEKPDGIFLSFGGQTALNCGLDLYRKGVLKKYKVEILGSPISAIELSEDRKKFAKHLKKINVSTPPSLAARNIKEAINHAEKLGYPVMVRSGFALGGQGSGIANNQTELKEILEKAFSFAKQVLIEKYLHHHKEVEYEVVRDSFDNAVAVCNMENMDPLGIHTGESIVIAPSQTLTNHEYHKLRSISIKIARSIGIIGECNVQFALNPNPKDGELEYYVIELNARLSRSSALASKATGYPLAYVAAKLALGKNLTELKNKITDATQFCFEPALDYVTVKIPRWDIEKFKNAEEKIGSSMKSVGEVMGIGRTFEEAYQKAIRMLDLDFEGAVNDEIFKKSSIKDVELFLINPTPKRIFAISEGLYRNMKIEKIYKLTGIDPWFLYRIKNIIDHEILLRMKLRKDKNSLDKQAVLKLKQLGISDKRIGALVGKRGLEIREIRNNLGIKPFVHQIDTLAGEFPAKTNYLYMTYNSSHNDLTSSGNDSVIVLGSGPYRIGSSVEFDWTSVTAINTLKKHSKKSIVINCNPETVSTDYDISDRLYFEELTFERIADIYEYENPFGIIVSVGGQTPNNRARALEKKGFKILGTSPRNIDRAEDRSKFSSLLDSFSISQPDWNKFTQISDALNFSKKVGFPVLVRPSFVLSGSNMRIIYSREELASFLKKILSISRDYPITISRFITDAKEIEIDAVAEKGIIKTFAISEHIENAGVHSGDASIIFPPQKIYIETLKQLRKIAEILAKELSITGPFNIQCLAKDNDVSVIEINLRASRTFPFISKVTGVNFIEEAVDAFFGKSGEEKNIDIMKFNFVAAKVAQFSFARLTGADPVLDVEMTSTGEVACFGDQTEEAFLKAEISVGGRIPKKGIFISLGGDENKIKFLETIKRLKMLKIPIFATEKTSIFLNRNGIKSKKLFKIHEEKNPNVLEYFQKGLIDLAINITDNNLKKDINDDYFIRRTAVDHNIPLFTNVKKAELFIKAITEVNLNELPVKSWDEYGARDVNRGVGD